MKRLFCLLLIILLCPCIASGEKEPEVFQSGDYGYTLLNDGTAEIMYYRGEEKSLTIPDKLDAYKVTCIKSLGFVSSVTSIIIPDSLTTIGDRAFYCCEGLTSIIIPDSVTTIGANPFINCEKLSKITVSPEHPTFALIEGVLFSKPEKRLICYPIALKPSSYNIPQGIATIDYAAFYGCSSLMSITIPDSVTSIGEGAFYGCSSLMSITIPDSVTSIGDWTFSSCSNLMSVTILGSVTSIGAGTFYSCSGLTSITIPDSVTTIGEEAFSECHSLTSITIPNSVTSIGDEAFFECSSLTSIAIPDSVTIIGEKAFSSCDSLTLTVSRGSYAAEYCKEKGLAYTYTDALDWLNN